MYKHQFKVSLAVSPPFVIDNSLRVIPNLGNTVDSPCKVKILEVHKISVIKASDSFEQLRSDCKETAGGILGSEGLCQILVKHCIFAKIFVVLPVACNP